MDLVPKVTEEGITKGLGSYKLIRELETELSKCKPQKTSALGSAASAGAGDQDFDIDDWINKEKEFTREKYYQWLEESSSFLDQHDVTDYNEAYCPETATPTGAANTEYRNFGGDRSEEFRQIWNFTDEAKHKLKQLRDLDDDKFKIKINVQGIIVLVYRHVGPELSRYHRTRFYSCQDNEALREFRERLAVYLTLLQKLLDKLTDAREGKSSGNEE